LYIVLHFVKSILLNEYEYDDVTCLKVRKRDLACLAPRLSASVAICRNLVDGISSDTLNMLTCLHMPLTNNIPVRVLQISGLQSNWISN